MLRKINLQGESQLDTDLVVIDQYSATIALVSAVGYVTAVKSFQKGLAAAGNYVYVSGIGNCKTTNNYMIETKKDDNDLMHLIASKKDHIDYGNNNASDERMTAYIYAKDRKELEEIAYNKMYKSLSVPMLREWAPALITEFENSYIIRQLRTYCHSDNPPFASYVINISKFQLMRIITKLIKNDVISIGGPRDISTDMANMGGLDSYLNSYGSTLARKIQENFAPKFTPGQDKYTESVNNFDDYCHHNGIDLFEAQKASIQASVNNFKSNDVTFVVGEMGSGKTIIGSGITYAHGKQTGCNSIVMCPSHLVNKWKREIDKFVPNSETHIVTDLSQLINLETKIKNKGKKENLYIIMSKESAKISYDLCPATNWSISKKAFICPECGLPLVKKVKVGEGRYRTTVEVPLSKDDMLKQNSINMICSNLKRKTNKELKSSDDTICGAKLWKPLNKESIGGSPWIKLGKEGWMLKAHIEEMHTELLKKETYTKKEAALLVKLNDQMESMKEDDSFIVSSRAPRRFPLSKYIKKYWKGNIDYFIGDEIHTYKGESEQGYAFADLANVADKTLCLTGTLLNGYADGLFYILYRVLPRFMQNEGFAYSDEGAFMRKYGVMKKTTVSAINTGNRESRRSSSVEKRLPGVSPIVFTNFLLENSVFISLSDMSEGLPSYTEIPIGVPMDEELSDCYTRLRSGIVESLSSSKSGLKIMGQTIQMLSVFPDMPYNVQPIIHPDTGEVVYSPPELNKGLRNKEMETLGIIQRKVDAGERVLVYYQWTNKTDSAQKLRKAISDLGIKVAVLESKISPTEREEWIEKKVSEGVQVVLCNPTLVETGLDLLDFTTIIFYQVGYNIFTMRQASRRSWRLGQEMPIEVYFLYYQDTVQEHALSLMASKLQASMAIEGKFSEEGLRAMSNNDDLLTRIAGSIVDNISETVNVESFHKVVPGDIVQKSFEDRNRKTIFEILYNRKPISSLSYFDRVNTNSGSGLSKIAKDIVNNKIPMTDMLKFKF